MSTIMDIRNAWRQDWQPAEFAGCGFWCETGSYECGQRVVIHEFPKKDEPYTELMGRRYYAYTVRGYCIANPGDTDYRRQRDALQQRLDRGDPGDLTLPFMKTRKHCVCRQYRLTEEDRYGGYCTFDMQFVEASTLPFKPTPAPRELLIDRALELHDRTLTVMAQKQRTVGKNLIVMDGIAARV